MPRFFPLTRTKTKIVQVGSGDVDVQWDDSLDVSDSLSGTLGPVNAEDSIDLSDELVVSDFNAQDSIDTSDQITEITGPDLIDGIDLNDSLSGTLGPVNAQDGFDAADELVVSDFNAQDSIDLTDQTSQIATDASDSMELVDSLSGTLGPVNAIESFDLSDAPDLDSLNMQESVDVSDAPSTPSLTTSNEDSINLSDRISDFTQLDDDSLHLLDQFDEVATQTFDSLDISDAGSDLSLDADDSLDVSDSLPAFSLVPFIDTVDVSDVLLAGPLLLPDGYDVADAFASAAADLFDSLDLSDASSSLSGVVTPTDTIGIADSLYTEVWRVQESIDIADARSIQSLTSATIWPNAVASNTGFANTANMTDTNTGTAATLTATQLTAFLSGSPSVTTNGTLVVSFPNPTWTPGPSNLLTASLSANWSTTDSGELQSGNSVNISLDYSLNEGSSWTSFATVTTLDSTGTPSVNLGTITWTQLQQLRFRATGSVISGQILLNGGATQVFNLFYARLSFTAAYTP